MTQQYTILFFLIISLLCCDSTNSQDTCKPTQVHLSLGDSYYNVGQDNKESTNQKNNNNQGYLVWHSQTVCRYFFVVRDLKNNQVVFNMTPSFFEEFHYDYVTNQSKTGSYNTIVHTVLMKGLKYEEYYNYSILSYEGQNLIESVRFRLTTPFKRENQNSKKLIVVGDIDAYESGMKTINRLSILAEKDFDQYAGIIQLGDIAYDIHDDNGQRGDKFFEIMTPIIDKWPFMMALGNHEWFANWSFANLRLRNPLYNTTQNQYYSYNWEGIHFTIINFDYYDSVSTEKQKAIFEWVEKDLNRANQQVVRNQFPWIVFIVHRPIYCCYQEQGSKLPPPSKWCYSFYEKRRIWDDLLHKYSVDLTLMGDKHSYERMGPIYQNQSAWYTHIPNDDLQHNLINPEATVFIMDGAAGNHHYTPNPYNASGYTIFSDVRPSYGLLYSQDSVGDRRLLYEHYVSETDEKIDYVRIIKIKTAMDSELIAEQDGPNSTTIFAVIVLGCIGALIYMYWKKNVKSIEEEEKLREKEIPLIVFKE